MGESDEINSSASKERLLSSSLSGHEDENVEHVRKLCPSKYFWVLVLGLGLSLVLNVRLLGHLSYKSELPRAATSPQSSSARSAIALYSPANDAVEYQLTKFASSVEGGETDFQGRPSMKLIKLGLYENVFTHIAEEKARMLPNKTAPKLESKGSGYLVVLNVFHDLHCMDNIRKGLYYFLEPQWNSTHNPYLLYESPKAA